VRVWPLAEPLPLLQVALLPPLSLLTSNGGMCVHVPPVTSITDLKKVQVYLPPPGERVIPSQT